MGRVKYNILDKNELKSYLKILLNLFTEESFETFEEKRGKNFESTKKSYIN